MSLERDPFIVPHFKALISCQNFLGGQGCGSTLSLCNALLKISILLHKMANECKVLHLIVCNDHIFSLFAARKDKKIY